MKILLVTESYWPNRDGGSVFERALVHGLGDLGHEVRVVAPSPKGKPYVQRDGRSEIHRVRSLRTPGRFKAWASFLPYQAIHRLIEGFQPDLIHGHNHWTIGRATLKLAKKFDIPYVDTYHNLPSNIMANIGPLRHFPNLEERLWQYDIKFLNQARYATSPTKTAIDLLVSHGLATPHKPISNGVNLQRYHPEVNPKRLRDKLHLPQKPIVSYVGRLDGEKAMDVWIKSIPLVLQEIDAHFLIGGGGSRVKALQRLAGGLGVADHVTFADFIGDADLPAFYRLSTVFAISSPIELQSLVTLEAMATGLPIVAADSLALPELCHSGRNGYLFLAGDPHGQAKSLIRILQNPAMGQKMGAESRRIVEQHHDIRLMPKHYQAVYREVRQ